MRLPSALPNARSIAVVGDADPGTVWHRYAELDDWSHWAPPIRRVEADRSTLGTGLTGVVHGPAGLRIPFEVLTVDDFARRWCWRVRVGPPGLAVAVEMTHDVLARPGGGSVAVLTVVGPLWTAGYLPVARIALGRLVARRPDGRVHADSPAPGAAG